MAVKPREIAGSENRNLRFSFCTLFTDRQEYEAFYQSCLDRGFDGDDCEYLYIDNSEGNRCDGFSGINAFLNAARGEYIVVCHQDIELIDCRRDLERRLTDLTDLDPRWALAGNAGGVNLRTLALRISDPHGGDQRLGEFPCRVKSLDENFIVIRAANRIAASGDLTGFHLYGADLCLVADMLGYSSWVIDYHVMHKSPGNVGGREESNPQGFYQCKKRFIEKYTRALRPRFIRTTCGKFALSGFSRLTRWLNAPYILRRASRAGY